MNILPDRCLALQVQGEMSCSHTSHILCRKLPAGLRSFLRHACRMLTGHLHEDFSLQAGGSHLPGLDEPKVLSQRNNLWETLALLIDQFGAL